MDRVVAGIIDKQHRAERGKWKFGTPQKLGLLVSFRMHTPGRHTHYLTMDILLFGPYNYIGVYVRFRTSPQYDDETRGTTTCWACVADHDSCYREGLEEILRQHRHDVVYVDDMFKDNWYAMVDVTEPLNEDGQGDVTEPLELELKAAQQWTNEPR